MSILSKGLFVAAAVGLGACAAEPPCTTSVMTQGGRTFRGELQSEWMGRQSLAGACTYRHSNNPAEFNLPRGLGLGL